MPGKSKRASKSTASRLRATSPSKKAVLPPLADSDFPIVGIGASAGGLEAVSQLLENLSPQTGMAFVLVQHLEPNHESALATLLARVTHMRVNEARNNLQLEPNHIYIIPPNKMMRLEKQRLKLLPR